MRKLPVLETQSWPRGVCPVHLFGEGRCSIWCLGARQDLYVLHLDYVAYWRAVGLWRRVPREAAA